MYSKSPALMTFIRWFSLPALKNHIFLLIVIVSFCSDNHLNNWYKLLRNSDYELGNPVTGGY